MPNREIDNTREDPRHRNTLVTGNPDFHSVTEAICGVKAEAGKPPKAWYIAFGISFLILNVLGAMIGYLFFTGVGVWNLNKCGLLGV